jgi:preprotein translocase subunit SecG
MGFVIGLLTVLMVLDCIVLVLLVLIQLPKKDAGAGVAFGGAATDALFGAGTGNVLTKISKYAATIFFVLALFLGLLQGRYHSQSTSKFLKDLEQGPGPAPRSALPPSTAQPTTPEKPLVTQPTAGLSNLILSTTQPEVTNTPVAPAAATNAAPQK